MNDQPNQWLRNSRSIATGVMLALALMAFAPLQAQTGAPESPSLAPAQGTAARSDEPIVEGYAAPAGDAAKAAAELQSKYQGRTDVRIAPDARTKQVIVIAPPAVQQEVARLLGAEASTSKTRTPNPEPRIPNPADSLPPDLITNHMQLKNLSWKEFEQQIIRIWGARLKGTTSQSGDNATYAIQSSSGPMTIKVDRRNGQIAIEAPVQTAPSWVRVISAIDAPPDVAGEDSEVISLDKADPAMIARAVSLVKAASGGQEPHRRRHIGQFVSMIFQPEAGAGAAAQPDGQPAPAQPGQPPEAFDPQAPVQPGEAVDEGAAGGAGGPIGPVQIEIILDTIVVRGRKRDVERVLQIIEEIERQSLEARPEVEVYHLKHIDGQALAEVITLVYADAFASQGRVTITPLVKPNAVLIIGRKENIPGVIELIQKLDQPVDAQSQIKVFPLKFLSSIDAERMVRNFFVARPGVGQDPRLNLGTRVLVIAEYRTNSLIVQASPRDLAEVALLLRSLDVDKAAATNEVRVFKLQNSVAEELAPVLQEAITGQAGGQAGVPQLQPQQQQGQGGQGATTPATATPRSTSLQLLQIGPNGEQNLLQTGVLANVRITADTRGNSLIVVGPASSMELMGILIDQLDALPAAEAQIKVFTIVNGDATALAEMLQTLFGTPTGGGGGAQGQPVGLQTATGAGESTLVPLRFSVDQRTNSIIASGNAGDLNVIYTILARLDQGDIRQRITTVYRLNNSPAIDVATALNALLQSQRDLNQAAPDLVSPYEQIEREVIIVPEEVSNSLIVSATPRYFEEIKRVVTELDRRPPMVAIQVLIAEVVLSDVDQFGIELGLQDSLLFDRGLVGGPRFAFNNAALGNDNTAESLATRDNVGGQALSNFSLGRADGNLGFGGLVLSASSESVNILIRALQQSQRIQVISRPQVQTLDNLPAFVQVGALVPRITSTTITNGISQSNTTDANVGIILGVTPRTSPDGMIVMEVNAEKSEVGPDSTGIPISIAPDGSVIRSPQILITTAQTTVSARSGQTVILGGLITKNQGETTRRVPYLGDIPVLGRLFRFDAVSNERRELLIILTPYIVQTDEQLDWLNLRETERMSWCVADVVNIHGPVPVAGNMGFNMHSAPIIFPDLDSSAPSPIPTTVTPSLTDPARVPTDPLPVPPPPPVPGLNYGMSLPPPVQSHQLPSSVLMPRGSQPPELRPLQPHLMQPALPPPGTQARMLPMQPPIDGLPAAGMASGGPTEVSPAVYQQPAR